MIYTKPQWYLPGEVALHNQANDCWVSINGKVLNLTKWLEEQMKLCRCVKSCTCPTKNYYCGDNCFVKCGCFQKGFTYCDARRLGMAILAFAGKDISHWFNGDDWVTYVHPIVGSVTPYYRFGPGINQPVVPSTRWRPIVPWWLDGKYVVGQVTAKTRPLRITNMCTGATITLEVCSEETIYQILMRYLPHNSHMHSYTYRYLGRAICLNKTLGENGIPDERERFSEVALPENLHIPALLAYFNDDLTEDLTEPKCYCYNVDCLNKPQDCFAPTTPNVVNDNSVSTVF